MAATSRMVRGVLSRPAPPLAAPVGGVWTMARSRFPGAARTRRTFFRVLPHGEDPIRRHLPQGLDRPARPVDPKLRHHGVLPEAEVNPVVGGASITHRGVDVVVLRPRGGGHPDP